MKKLLSLGLTVSVLTALLLTGCAQSSPPAGGANPSPPPGGGEENLVDPDATVLSILEAIIADTNAELEDAAKVPPMLFTDQITEDNCESATGLTKEQFEQYVTEGYSAKAAIISVAFELILVKCENPASAAEVKSLMADGYDPGKWICACPRQTFIVDSGSYVFLASTMRLPDGEEAEAMQIEALQQAFGKQFGGKTGSVNAFYEFQ